MAFTNVPASGGACSLRIPTAPPVTGDIELIAGSNITITQDTLHGTFTLASSGGGSPAGSDKQIQYNDNGSFGASSTLVFIPPAFEGAGPVIQFNSTAGGGIGFYEDDGTTLIMDLGANEGIFAIEGPNAEFDFYDAGQLSFPQISADPADPAEGSIWYRVDNHEWRGFNGTANGTFTFVED